MSEEGEKKQGFCRTLLKFLFSHVGLILMVIIYVIAGGFIFENLERPNEQQICWDRRADYLPVENSTLEQLYLQHTSSAFKTKDQVKAEFSNQLSKYISEVLVTRYSMANCSMMGKPGGEPFEWSWSGAMLFSVTVVSTIGYGNIAPRTPWGRVVCIAYALLGIPLMLLCLANIGDVMADIFRFIYTKVCCCGCCRKKKRNPNEDKGQFSWVQQPDDDSDDDEEDDDEKITVPLTITMCVIFSYLMGGAVLFGVWENWEPVAAFYFCFVTLTTIGFGDLVPGTENLSSTSGQVQMALAGVYVLFGMAIISMCFNLMQDEMVAKFKWLGEKIGLIDKKEEEEEDEGIQEPAANHYNVEQLKSGK